jgi:hypothetical protein
MTVTSHVAEAPSGGLSTEERTTLIRYLLGLRHQALLTVRDHQGVMQTSLVDVQGGDRLDSVVFATDEDTAAQIDASPSVVLTYPDWHSGSWLVLNGVARVRLSGMPAWCRDTVARLIRENPRSTTQFEVEVITADVWE